MKVFKIPVWDNDSGVTHISTSWQLASDTEFKNIITEVVDSTKFLDYWSINVVVPKGKIYYVRSKRKFKEVENDNWIGPKKVINDEAGLSEIIKPETKIDDPYIADVKLDYEDGLTLTLSPFKGNVPHVSTTWLIRNMETGEMIYKSINDEKNKTSLNIKPKEIDFSNIPYVTITTLFHGMLGVESSPTVEIVELSKKYYDVIANKKIVPSDEDYTGSINQLTSRKVTLTKAELFIMNGNKLANGKIDGNKYTFASEYLIPNISYLVKLTLKYDNDDKLTFTNTYTFFTKSVTEKVVFDRKRLYKELNTVEQKDKCIVIDKMDADTKTNGLLNNVQVLTEETYVGVIPMLGKDKKLKSYFFSKNDKMFNFVKNIPGFDSKYETYLKIELAPNNEMYVDTITTEKDKDGNDIKLKTLYVFKFNPYTEEVKLISTFKRNDELVVDFNTNSYGVLNGEFYWAAVDANDRTKVYIRKIDKNKKEIVTLAHKRLDKDVDTEMDNVMFARTTEDRFIVVPQYYSTDSEFFGFIYDVSKDETYKLFTIPKEVRTQHTVTSTLDNGNVLIRRTQLEDGKLYFAIIDGGDSKEITTKYAEPMIDKDIELKNNVRLKSGNVISFGFKDDKATMMLWE